MSQIDPEVSYAAMTDLFAAPWLRTCSFRDEFCNAWRRVLRGAARNNRSFPPDDPHAVFAISHVYGTELTFHFNQEKLLDWFRQDSKLGNDRRVFLPKALNRHADGSVGFHDSPLRYDPTLDEPATAGEKAILVAPLPAFPPILQVVCGNNRVEQSFCGLRKRKLPFHLIGAEFVPTFLGSSFEMCVYLFWMDCCIMSENRGRVSDKNLRPLLHIFRESSILTLNGLA